MSIDTILNDIEVIKEEIDKAKQDKAELRGIITEQMKNLKKLGASSIAEAKKMIASETKKMNKLEKEITKSFSTLEGMYQWD